MAKKLVILSCLLFAGMPLNVFAEARQTVPFLDSELTQPVALVMLAVIVLLLCVIAVLGKVLFYAVDTYKRRNSPIVKGLAILLTGTLLGSGPLFAQDTAVGEPVASGFGLIGGLSPGSFYLLFGIIVLEVVIILVMVGMFRFLAGLERVKHPSPLKTKKKFAWFEKLNNTKSVDAQSESEISLGHDYDGIGELDNPTPPWWQWGFVLSVVFGIAYMYVYHIGKTAPLQLEELAIANKKAEAAIKAHLAVAGNMVDETTVEMLADASDLAAGQNVFVSACAACHAADGGGLVGPNLTDDYWLHGGSIKDVFKTIKYGVPEKGMKSWKDDYSPRQIAQISSYIMTLRGKVPAAPKEAQGDLYQPESGQPEVVADSAGVSEVALAE